MPVKIHKKHAKDKNPVTGAKIVRRVETHYPKFETMEDAVKYFGGNEALLCKVLTLGAYSALYSEVTKKLRNEISSISAIAQVAEKVAKAFAGVDKEQVMAALSQIPQIKEMGEVPNDKTIPFKADSDFPIKLDEVPDPFTDSRLKSDDEDDEDDDDESEEEEE